MERDADVFARIVVAETGKTITQASREVRRCVNTLGLSADEARRNAGEIVPFDAFAGSEDRRGWLRTSEATLPRTIRVVLTFMRFQ